jgi:hypothetical protein
MVATKYGKCFLLSSNLISDERSFASSAAAISAWTRARAVRAMIRKRRIEPKAVAVVPAPAWINRVT